MIPVKPDWQEVVGHLYRRYGSYHAILNALADQGVAPSDHSFLVYLRSGKRKAVSWALGAALLNLHIDVVGPAAVFVSSRRY